MLATFLLPLTLAMTELGLPSGPSGPLGPSGPSAIVGGDRVEPGAHPAVVSVSLDLELACTGILLAPDLVLTAAHCFDHPFFSPSRVQIGLGDDADAPDQRLGVTAYGMHPEYCNPKRDESCDPHDIHDYAWVRLDGEAAIDPAAVPSIVTDDALHHRIVRKGAELELVGYGNDDDARKGHKRTVLVDITNFLSEGRELRAGGDGADSCFGDSGGPALARLPDGGTALVGVLSRGSDPCGKGGIYGAPLPALCWIRDDSGAPVVPSGCEDCSCVDLTPREDDEDHGCSMPASRPPPAAWWLVLGLGLLARRRQGHAPSLLP